MVQFIEQNLKPPKEMYAANTDSKLETVPPERFDALPYHLGANVRDFQRLKYVITELKKRPYFNPPPIGKHHAEARNAYIKKQQEKVRKQKQREEFFDLVQSIFDPLSINAIKGTDKMSLELMGKTYDAMVDFYVRKIQRPGIITQLPDYLDTFKYKDDNDVKQLVIQILQNTFDFKAEEERLNKIVSDIRNSPTKGNAVKKSDLMDYPGDKKYIEHLEQIFDFKYRRPKIKKEEETKRMWHQFFEKKAQRRLEIEKSKSN